MFSEKLRIMNMKQLFFKSPISNLRHLRISDDCMDGVRETAPPRHGYSPSSFRNCYSPRRLLAWLLKPLWRNKERQNNVSDSETPIIESDRRLHRNDDTSFKLGVGCAFLYLIAASKNELHKIVELRKEMETLLQNVKAELKSKDSLTEQSKQSDAIACSITDIQQVSRSNSHISIHSQTLYVQPQSKCDMVHNRFLEYKEIKEDECAEEINELQAEFEFELERLHLYFDGEAAFGDAQRQRVEGNVKDASSKSHSSSFGEIVMDPQGASADVSFAVSPVELERRLHELLEARLQERITELESALECNTQKLMEKEMEVTWWRDTARLFSQHIPETSRFTFPLDPETALKFSHL